LAGVDLSGSTVDVGEPFWRKKVVEVLGFLLKIVPQNVGDVFIDAPKASFRRAELSLLVELIIKLNLVHISSSLLRCILTRLRALVTFICPFMHFMTIDSSGALAATQEHIGAHIDMTIRRMADV
jgi:hypothetical protein